MANKQESTIRYLVRIANTDLPGEKQILHAMTKIKGVGVNFAHAVLNVAKVPGQSKTGLLSDEQVAAINGVLSDPVKHGIPGWVFNRQREYETGESRHTLGADLDFAQQNDIKRLKMIKSYKGLRHAWRLPLRGQRTKSNFRKSKAKGASGAKKGRKSAPPSRGGN